MAQDHPKSDTTHIKSNFQKKKPYVIITNDGTEYVGEIESDDGREILVNTKDKGEIYISKNTIRSIELQTAHTAKSTFQKKKTYIIVTNDGTEYVGEIESDNAREILINTKDKGQMFIPKYSIKSIDLLTNENYQSGELITPNHFQNYYMASTNALPFKRNEVIANTYYFFGYSFNYSLNENVAIGLHTTFLCKPIGIGVKTSFAVSDKDFLGIEMHGGYLSLNTVGGNNTLLGHLGVKYTHGDAAGSVTLGAGIGSIAAAFSSTYAGTADKVGYYFYSAGGKRLSKGSMGVYEFWTAPNNNATLVGVGLRLMKKPKTSFTFGILNFISRNYSTYNGTSTSGGSTRVQTFPYLGMCFKI